MLYLLEAHTHSLHHVPGFIIFDFQIGFTVNQAGYLRAAANKSIFLIEFIGYFGNCISLCFLHVLLGVDLCNKLGLFARFAY